MKELIEKLKAAEQNAAGMFEIDGDTICELMKVLSLGLTPFDELAGKFLQAGIDRGGRVSSAYTECAHLLAKTTRELRKSLR